MREKGALFRLLTCGSVDDGKSTLIGRLLWDAAGVTDDQRAAITLASHNRAVNGEKIDFSLLLDGLQAEREQGITIDIAWRYFETPDRRFIIIDSPGHEQYTRNMATGASHADIAILLVDARHGAKRQTRRHAAICDLVGIKKVVLAINKMDAVDWSEARYREIEADFRDHGRQLQFRASRHHSGGGADRRQCGPSLDGDVLVWRADAARLSRSGRPRGRHSRRAVPHAGAARAPRLGRFPRLCRHGHLGPDRRRRADRRCAKRARRHAPPDRHHGRRSSVAAKGDAVTLVLDTDLDISRGAVLSEVPRRPTNADVIEARLVWLSETPFDPEAGYLLRTATDLTPVTSMSVSALVDFETLAVAARACLRRQRHRRLPHPARPAPPPSICSAICR